MNTSANTNQIHTATTITARTTPVGFRRRTMAGALVVMALTGTAVGLAATSHADDGPGNPSIDIVAPALPAVPVPPLPAPAVPWVQGALDWAFHPHLHCGHRGFDGKFRCDWF